MGSVPTLAWGVPSLARGYLPWLGGIYLGCSWYLSWLGGYLPWLGGYLPWLRGTYLGCRVSTLDGVSTYLGWGRVPSLARGLPTLDGVGTYLGQAGYLPCLGVPTLAGEGNLPWPGYPPVGVERQTNSNYYLPPSYGCGR